MLRPTLLVLAVMLSGCASVEHPKSMTLMAGPDRSIRPVDQAGTILATPALSAPPNPVAAIRLESERPYVPPASVLKAPERPTASSNCVVDFSDHDALALLPDAAKTTFASVPWWFQACNGLLHAVVRPIGEDHYHLGYENPHVTVCEVTPGVFDYGILGGDGTCTAIDPTQEPRSLYPHLGQRTTHIYVWDGSRKQPFRLDSIRVEGSVPIRLCYKPWQDTSGPWETSQPDGTTEPGIWFCWSSLSTGNWDLSAWTNFTTEVKIRASDNVGIYEIDDIQLGL
ncbi:hypothetical protein YTPLAS18_32210 [Nitrospira sp.]|nr:hypothetical protein YTPLAS18_32210 [Nitrospira sp.]